MLPSPSLRPRLLGLPNGVGSALASVDKLHCHRSLPLESFRMLVGLTTVEG